MISPIIPEESAKVSEFCVSAECSSFFEGTGVATAAAAIIITTITTRHIISAGNRLCDVELKMWKSEFAKRGELFF